MTLRTIGEKEGDFSSAIESQTSKIPSVGYLTAAIGSMAGSAIFKSSRKRQLGSLRGQWGRLFYPRCYNS